MIIVRGEAQDGHHNGGGLPITAYLYVMTLCVFEVLDSKSGGHHGPAGPFGTTTRDDPRYLGRGQIQRLAHQHLGIARAGPCPVHRALPLGHPQRGPSQLVPQGSPGRHPPSPPSTPSEGEVHAVGKFRLRPQGGGEGRLPEAVWTLTMPDPVSDLGRDEAKGTTWRIAVDSGGRVVETR